MADNDNKPDAPNEAPTGTAPEAETPEQPEKLFTGADVERIVRDRLARAKKEPKVEQRAAPNGDTRTTDPAIAELQARQRFLEAVADMPWKPSKEDREMLWNLHQSSGPEAMLAVAERFAPKPPPAPAAPDKTEPPKQEASYKSPGAPAGAPPEVLNRDATKWTGDYVRTRSEQIDEKTGKSVFFTELQQYRDSLPGGSNGVFRRRIPK